MLYIINQTIYFTALNFSFHNKNAGSTSNPDRGSDLDPPKDKQNQSENGKEVW